MARLSYRLRAGTACIAAVVLLVALFQGEARATPGSNHTAVGFGVEYTSGACTGSLVCPAGTSGDQFSINASDKAGANGWMQLNDVRISLDCVVIRDWDGRTLDGHTLDASGFGTDGKKYFAHVTATYAGTGSFIVGSHAGGNECGSSWYGVEGYGSFVIAAT